MKKLLAILVLSLLWYNISLASDGVGSFKCDSIGTQGENMSFSINLNNRTMKFGFGDYKITSITNEKIRGLIPDKNDGKNFRKELIFDRYTGELLLVHFIKPPFFWNMKCRKAEDIKKIF